MRSINSSSYQYNHLIKHNQFYSNLDWFYKGGLSYKKVKEYLQIILNSLLLPILLSIILIKLLLIVRDLLLLFIILILVLWEFILRSIKGLILIVIVVIVVVVVVMIWHFCLITETEICGNLLLRSNKNKIII